MPRLSWKAFCRVVSEVLAGLPVELAGYLDNITVDVEEAPSRRLLHEMDVPDDETLMGVFQGLGIDEIEYGDRPPNRIVIFKRPIEDAADSLEEVRYEIRRTVLHELAHHFGFSEEDLDFFEERPSPFDGPPDE